ncbi:transcriptional regulator, DeoR family [Thermobaculum terrenum ATCC BAA-798]|uniref:Lactose phosphotransferase system repressor n=1 Tax=Thermobaculum terrenum (strain ATCC BAA-798 / CCMEE 7001 / YNP1) TaxID=525904 RepID=D1CGF4_THET1|nr:DeoR/GlpR family DNA-binding transcription regulator [Thermobaculum terrenum]ACZ42825.1 transcriptional regulator, DeoR family [Thermobaculum terrenum ATCC BAA-798]
MLTEERKRFILETLAREGKVLAHDLSKKLGVSDDTIRRDLRDLAREGLLVRVHGGALPRSQSITAPYSARQQQEPVVKAAIAEAAAKLVENGQVIILDGGTTTLQVAQHLPKDLHATVVTNSPPIAVALGEHPYVEVVVLGGRLYKHGMSTVGAATLQEIQMIRADLCMLGVGGLHPELGLTTDNLEEAHVKRAMVASAAEVVALASAEKIMAAQPYIVAPLADLTHVVTEASVPREELAPFEAAGLTIILA